MAIAVQQSLAGFIASEADVSFTDAGITQVRFRVVVEHSRREHDGTFTKLDNSFHELLIFGRTADRAAAQLRKSDQFVAHGYLDTRYAELPAPPAEREVYVERKIGHDLTRTAYDVDRIPATARQDEAMAAVGAENGQSSGGAGQNVPPTPLPVMDRAASLHPGASLGHGIGP